MTKVELFEAIRRDHVVHKQSIRALARRYGVHRRAVRQALKSAIPPTRKRPKREPPVLTSRLCSVVDGWLEADRAAPRKQRHTARRIWKRLVTEHAFGGAESTIRRYVGRRRRELGVRVDAFVPQTYVPGEMAEVDWYEAQVDFPGGRRTAQILLVRASYSGREFHIAFPRQTQQAFLEGLAAAFDYFGGVFATLRFDNLTAAVRKVLQGRQRLETDRFVALRSHYLFAAEFCRPGKEGAHEKGGVEGAVGRFRRNHLVPVPTVADFDQLNGLLLGWCGEDDQRRIQGRSRSIAEDWHLERAALRPLPAEPFSTAEVSTYAVDQKSRVVVRTNHYSVPMRYVGRRVEGRVHARRVELVHDGRVIATHERLQGHHGESLQLDHYLELLRMRPAALARSRPLRQARDAGHWPDDYDRLWKEFRERYGDANGTRQLVEVLMLHREHAAEIVHVAVSLSLELGCCDAGAVAVLLRQLAVDERPVAPLSDIGDLARYGQAANADMSNYDALLAPRPAEAQR